MNKEDDVIEGIRNLLSILAIFLLIIIWAVISWNQ